MFRNTLKQVTRSLLQRIHMECSRAGAVQHPLGVRNKHQGTSLFLMSTHYLCSPAPQTCCTARATTCQWHCDSPLWVRDSPSANLGFVSSISEEQQPRNVFQQKSWPRTCTVFLMILQNSNFPLYLPNTMEIAVHKCVWKLKPSD